MSRGVLAGVALALWSTAVMAPAQDLAEKVQVHTFGSWSYGSTNGNEYLSGIKGGSYDDASLALNVVSSVSDKLHLVGQGEWVDSRDGTEILFDYAFAEWTFSPKFKMRAGKVKQPFGISAEVFDVGTLRPFIELPQAVYGPVGLVGESYKGIGFTGLFEWKGGWGLSYDLYGGGQELEEYVPPEAVLLGEPFDDPVELERTKDMVGGRAVVQTPVAGLTFGASGYVGHEIGSQRRHAYGGQAEYLDGKWSLRTEYVHESVKDDLKADGFYAEAAYRFTPHWQGAVQYGRLTSEVAATPVVDAPSLERHEEIAVGLNYWWNRNFVMKLSYQHVDGNRFAGPPPADLAEAATAGTLDPKTNLVMVGAQFSF